MTMLVDRWIAEFSDLSPVDITDMDFRKAARLAVENGITPQQVLSAIGKMTRDKLVALAGCTAAVKPEKRTDFE